MTTDRAGRKKIAAYPVNTILSWMQGHTVTQGWDVVCAIAYDKINEWFLEQYVERLSAGEDAVINGSVQQAGGISIEAVDPTPRTLDVYGSLRCCDCCVLSVSWSLFPGWRRRREGMVFARVSRRVWRAVPRSAAPAGGAVPPSCGAGLDSGLGVAGCEHGDLGFSRDGLLGRRGMREFRAGFLRAIGVAFASGDVEGMQRGAGGGVRRGGERVQR